MFICILVTYTCTHLYYGALGIYYKSYKCEFQSGYTIPLQLKFATNIKIKRFEGATFRVKQIGEEALETDDGCYIT